MTEENEPRVVSLEAYAFNFGVSLEDRIRARAGAPAFAMRRKRLDRALKQFWDALQRRSKELWIAAGEGRIADDGKELRHNLLDDEGRDRLGEVEHKRRLHKLRVDYDEDRREGYNRAWRRHLEDCGLDDIAAQVELYNRYFPIEAKLPTDPETGRYVWMGKPWDPMDPPDVAAVLDRFPLK